MNSTPNHNAASAVRKIVVATALATALATAIQFSGVASSAARTPNIPAISRPMIGAWAIRIAVFVVSRALTANVRRTNLHH
ncbi:MAG: hypothetical protein EA424_04400 [Planctomycetaceae bacterium]|nr:MAG: hypothetical protein EA424_04400 [Planctomycetaceae bacterium]